MYCIALNINPLSFPYLRSMLYPSHLLLLFPHIPLITIPLPLLLYILLFFLSLFHRLSLFHSPALSRFFLLVCLSVPLTHTHTYPLTFSNLNIRFTYTIKIFTFIFINCLNWAKNKSVSSPSIPLQINFHKFIWICDNMYKILRNRLFFILWGGCKFTAHTLYTSVTCKAKRQGMHKYLISLSVCHWTSYAKPEGLLHHPKVLKNK